MPRHFRPFVMLAVLPLFALVTPRATAHGGGPYRAPGGMEPPGIKRPSQFEAPAPVGRPRRATSFEDWFFWWHHNTDRLEAEVAPRIRLEPEGARKALRGRVLETLRKLVDPKTNIHQAIRANSIRALARSTQDPQDAWKIFELTKNPGLTQIELEAAVIGLGLLRRSDPKLQFPTRVYDRVRAELLKIFDDEQQPSRHRAFAMLALGLLGDQPFGEGEASAESIGVTIESKLRGKYPSQDLLIGILIALAHQPPAGVTDGLRETLRETVLRGRLARDSANDTVRSQAALTLGRIGTGEDISLFEKVLRTRRGMPRNVQRSAAIALGRIGARLPLDERRRVAKTILERNEKEAKDVTTRSLLTTSLVPLLVAGDQAEQAALLRGSKADEHLLEVTRKGRYLDRAYAALALGLVLRALPAVPKEVALIQFRREGIEALQEAFSSPQGGAFERAADGLALAIVNDPASTAVLKEVAADPKRQSLVRDYLLLGLALQPPSSPTRKWTHTLARSMTTPGFPVLVLRSLGLTANQGVPALGPSLLLMLKQAKSQNQKGEAAVALARLGTDAAIEGLIRLALDENEQDLSRAMAVVGLGRVADPELVPSQVILIEGMNYRAQTDLTNELLSLY